MRLISSALIAFTMVVGGSATADPAAGPAPASTAATPAASEILGKMEATNNGYSDQMLNERLTVVDVDGTRRIYDLTFRQKGAKRLVEFTSGESKGMAVLIEARDSVYVYLPGFRKVRRVASSAMDQSIVGSDLSNDDMATVSWGQLYDVTLDREDDTSFWLSLVPKQGVETNYGKVVHRVDKSHFLQQETHWYNRAGQEVKRLVASQPTSYDGGAMRYKLAIFSDPRTGHRTELDTLSAKYNQGLSDDVFTLRQLQWGK
jgi:outer membrane lipoprotein-sorting protein